MKVLVFFFFFLRCFKADTAGIRQLRNRVQCPWLSAPDLPLKCRMLRESVERGVPEYRVSSVSSEGDYLVKDRTLPVLVSSKGRLAKQPRLFRSCRPVGLALCSLVWILLQTALA